MHRGVRLAAVRTCVPLVRIAGGEGRSSRERWRCWQPGAGGQNRVRGQQAADVAMRGRRWRRVGPAMRGWVATRYACAVLCGAGVTRCDGARAGAAMRGRVPRAGGGARDQQGGRAEPAAWCGREAPAAHPFFSLFFPWWFGLPRYMWARLGGGAASWLVHAAPSRARVAGSDAAPGQAQIAGGGAAPGWRGCCFGPMATYEKEKNVY